MTHLTKLAASALVTGAGLATVVGIGASPAHAGEPVVPEHAVITCQSATMYANYDHAGGGPTGVVRTLGYANKVGHTRGAHLVYNGWAAIFDFGPNDWGYVRYECLGGWGSW